MIDTSMYTVLRGKELHAAKGKEPRAIHNNGEPIGTHKKGVSMGRATPAHRTLDASRWVALAAEHDADKIAKRPVLAQVWQMQGTVYTLAADGYRLHIVQGSIAGAITAKAGEKWQDAEGEKHTVPDFLALVSRKGEHRVTFASDALWRALHAVRPFSLDSSNIVRFHVSEGEIEVSATSAEMGDARATLDARGSDTFAFALNCKYAIEMLAGMGEQCEVRREGHEGNPVYFVSGEREGVVMPMSLSR